MTRLEQGVMSGQRDGRVERHVVVGGQLLARAGSDDRQAVQVFYCRSASGQSGCLDLHRAADLHELGHPFGPGSQQGRKGGGETRRGQVGDIGALSPPADHQEALGFQLAQRLPHRRTSHAQLVRQLTLRGYAVAGLVLA